MGLWVGPLASAPSVHPREVSGVGPQSANLGAATELQVSAGAAYPEFTVQGLRGEGRHRPQLLQRVL